MDKKPVDNKNPIVAPKDVKIEAKKGGSSQTHLVGPTKDD